MAQAERTVAPTNQQQQSQSDAPQQQPAPAKRFTGTPLPRDYWEIELALQWPYRRAYDKARGWHWVWRSDKSHLSARVYPNLKKKIIHVTVFDDDAKLKDAARAPGMEVEMWTRELRMTGDWERRLSSTCGEAMVLAQLRPKCPDCKQPMALIERNDGAAQFFGCRHWPHCDGSADIIEYGVEKRSGQQAA